MYEHGMVIPSHRNGYCIGFPLYSFEVHVSTGRTAYFPRLGTLRVGSCTGRCDAVMEDVVFRLQQLAEVRNLQGISFGDCVNCCRKLGAKRLILAEQGGKRLWMRISLNVPQDDVVEVLQQDATIVWLQDLNY